MFCGTWRPLDRYGSVGIEQRAIVQTLCVTRNIMLMLAQQLNRARAHPCAKRVISFCTRLPCSSPGHLHACTARNPYQHTLHEVSLRQPMITRMLEPLNEPTANERSRAVDCNRLLVRIRGRADALAPHLTFAFSSTGSFPSWYCRQCVACRSALRANTAC